jgi:outer membrane protein W
MRTCVPPILVVAAMCAAPAAAQQGEWYGTLSLTGARLDARSQPVADTGSSVELDDGYAVTFAAGWMAREDWSLETSISLARLEADSVGGDTDGLELGNLWTTWITAGVQYHVPLYSKLEPIVGVGAVLVWPFADDLTRAANDSGVGELKSDPAFGWTANAGLAWHTSASWAWRLDLRFLDADSDLEVRNNGGQEVDTVTLPFDGWTVSVGGSWRF